MKLELIECIANVANQSEAAAMNKLKDYDREDLLDECRRLEIANVETEPTNSVVVALIKYAKKMYGPKHDYETAYFHPLDITLIVDHQLDKDCPLRLVNFYYGHASAESTEHYIELAATNDGLHERTRIGGDIYDVVYTQSLNVTVISLDQHDDRDALKYVGSYHGKINTEFTASAIEDFLTKESAELSHASGRLMVAIARKEHQQEIVVKYLDSDTASALVKVCNLQNIGMPQLLDSFVECRDQYVLGYAEVNDAEDVESLLKIMEDHSNI